MKIKDKIIWITGASSGIGEALSILAVSSGARVILSARSVTRLETLKKQLEAISPGSSSVVPLDVTKPEEINKAVDTVTCLLYTSPSPRD